MIYNPNWRAISIHDRRFNSILQVLFGRFKSMLQAINTTSLMSLIAYSIAISNWNVIDVFIKDVENFILQDNLKSCSSVPIKFIMKCGPLCPSNWKKIGTIDKIGPGRVILPKVWIMLCKFFKWSFTYLCLGNKTKCVYQSTIGTQNKQSFIETQNFCAALHIFVFFQVNF